MFVKDLVVLIEILNSKKERFETQKINNIHYFTYVTITITEHWQKLIERPTGYFRSRGETNMSKL